MPPAPLIRATWIEGNFGTKQEKQFYAHYRSHLRKQDHRERLERLIWEDRYWPARRMLWRVDKETRPAGRGPARPDADPRRRRCGHRPGPRPSTRSMRGLIYERLRWRRRKGRHESARELLADLPADPLQPEKWWIERAVLARDALDKGHISEAYRIAKEHGLSGRSQLCRRRMAGRLDRAQVPGRRARGLEAFHHHAQGGQLSHQPGPRRLLVRPRRRRP